MYLPIPVEIRCDAPNNKLEKFDGTLYLKGADPVPLSNENIVLRGCCIRNTKFVHGIAVYTGRDTKLMRNSGRPGLLAGGLSNFFAKPTHTPLQRFQCHVGNVRFKRTHIDKQLNKLVISIFIILVCMCMLMAILSANWEQKQGNVCFGCRLSKHMAVLSAHSHTRHHPPPRPFFDWAEPERVP